MLNLLPQDTVFFDLFEGMGRLAIASAQHLKELTEHFPNITDDISRIRQAEHSADQIAHNALERLDRTFITPFDREDIHQLVIELDDIIDNIDALAKRFALFHVKSIEPTFIKQCDVLVQATQVLSDAVGQLRKTHKLTDLNPPPDRSASAGKPGGRQSSRCDLRFVRWLPRAIACHEVEGNLRLRRECPGWM